MLDSLESSRLITPLSVKPDHFLPVPGESPPASAAHRGIPFQANPLPPEVTQAPAPQVDVKAPTSVPKSPAGDPGEDFEEFSGRKAPAGVPKGARNVKCNEVIRDPDSGRISKIITYDMDEEPSDGA